MAHCVDVCIVGAGPAGMVLGLLLAKQGVSVLVLEHHPDFDREYRGEVLMPRFTQMTRQIGLFDHIQKYPHLKLTELEGFYRDKLLLSIDFKEIAPEAPFAIWMPQPILLNALFDQAKQYPSFDLWFDARATGLLRNGKVTTGVSVERKHEKILVHAKVTVGADGRFSIVRREGHFDLIDEDHKFDLIWFTIPKPAGYDNKVRFFFSSVSNFLILPKYPDLIQCGLVTSKGGYSEYQKKGIDSLRDVLLKSHPFFHDFARSLKNFSPFNVLQAKIELVRKWVSDGLVLVGDSAHTCSPAGAIGVSVAVGSAIIAADIIREAILSGDVSEKTLGKIQKLREKEVKHIQRLQKRFTQVLFPSSGWMRFARPGLLWLAARSGLVRRIQRDMLAMHEPLPVGSVVKL